MARENASNEYIAPLRRLMLAVIVLFLVALFLLWRIDNPRVERFRAQVVDRVVPSMEWAMVPVTATIQIVRDFQSYHRIAEQNQELRRELRLMAKWKEAALQLEEENAELRALNNVQLDPKLTFITGVVLADSGSPFRQSILINVGSQDGIVDGWATTDGLGLVGRISGVDRRTSRVIVLTDASSRIPAELPASKQRAVVVGDNSAYPPLDFLEDPGQVHPGDRVLTSGDGEVFPSGLLIGEVVRDVGGRLRVRLTADLENLEFLRILRDHGTRRVSAPSTVILPQLPPGTAAGPSLPPSGPILDEAQDD